MKHRLHVVQNENHTGDFWYTIAAGNAETIATSKMYAQRWLAKRAARRFIAAIDPVPVTFHYFSGPTPAVVLSGRFHGQTRHHVEKIR